MHDPLPDSYYLFFRWFEPFTTLIGAAYSMRYPHDFSDSLVPATTPKDVGSSEKVRILSITLGNCFFLLCLISFSAFGAIRKHLSNNPKLQEMFVYAMLIPLAVADVTHVGITLSPYPWSSIIRPFSWSKELQANVGLTVLLFVGRLCYFSGVGRTTTVSSASKKASGGKNSQAAVKATTTPSEGLIKRAEKWLKIGAILTIGWVLIKAIDAQASRFFVFTPERLNAMVQETLADFPQPAAPLLHLNGSSYMPQAQRTEPMIRSLINRIENEFPEARVQKRFEDPSEWVFNNAAGAMGSMFIIHASITEYLIIFGTALGTEGHTGRHTADDYFHILRGAQWAYPAGALEKEVYEPGSVHHLRRGDAKQYKMPDECWALEYARGWIPPMLPMGLADTLFSTLDFWSFYHTARLTAREMIANLVLHGKI